MNRSRGFWNLLAKNYAKRPVDNPDAYAKKLSITQALLKPDMEVFEYGCGSGTTALKHAPHVTHIQAIDYSPKMIEIACAKAKDADINNVSFEISTLANWQAQDASYDMIQAHSVLHLLPDLDAALARTRDLIKPGGVFVSSTVCAREETFWTRALLPIGGTMRILPYIAMFDGAQLIDAIEVAGFEVEQQWRPREKGSIFIVARAV